MDAATCLDLDTSQAFRCPNVLVRPYFTGRPDPFALGRALGGPPYVGHRIQLGNESNLPLEGFGGGPTDYARWFLDVVSAAPPDARLYYGPPSPGMAGWQDYYTDPDCEEAIRASAGLSVHCYGSAAGMMDVVRFVCDLWPDKPVWVSECNFGAGNTVDIDAWADAEFAPFLDAAAAVPTVEAVTFFAFEWDQSPTLPSSVDGRGTRVEEVLHAWTPFDPEPPPDPLEEIGPLNDRCWQLCSDLQLLSEDYQDAGWASTASGIASGAETIKRLIAAVKGSR